jgi:hypothetical protein
MSFKQSFLAFSYIETKIQDKEVVCLSQMIALIGDKESTMLK